jgi:hypothetical protein
MLITFALKLYLMKKYIILVLLFAFTHSYAQPLMNKLYDFQLGHVYSYKKVPTGWNIDTTLIQTMGSNLIWNFDTITLLPDVYSDSIIDPTGTPGAAAFSNADFVWKEYSGTLQYYRKNLDTVFYMGNYTFFPSTFTPNPMTCIFNTPQSSNYLYSNFQTAVAGNGTWTYSARYNASGTLNLPGVTHTNVGLYVTVGGNTTKYADYLWFKENQNDPVMRIQFVWNNSGSTVQYLYVNTTSLTPTPVIDISKSNIDISPNPASNQIQVSAQHTIQKCEVVNLFGQVVKSNTCKSKSTNIDLSTLHNGLYIIKAYCGNNKVLIQKFIKE